MLIKQRKRIIDENESVSLISDLFDYSDLITEDRFFLDFYKAFDIVENLFIFCCFEQLGFGRFV